MATVESKVGPQIVADGATTQARLGKSAEAVTTDAHSRFYEGNYRSKRFKASTAQAGVAGQQATTIAATCAFALANPSNSGVNAVIDKLTIGLISGTAGICTYVWAYYAQGSTALGGTAVTPKAANLSSTASACTCATGTSAVGGAPSLLAATGISTGAEAGGATMPSTFTEPVDGAIIVPPGQALVLFALGAAGTSEKNVYSLDWEEVPV